jgi:hypothetical protein
VLLGGTVRSEHACRAPTRERRREGETTDDGRHDSRRCRWSSRRESRSDSRCAAGEEERGHTVADISCQHAITCLSVSTALGRRECSASPPVARSPARSCSCSCPYLALHLLEDGAEGQRTMVRVSRDQERAGGSGSTDRRHGLAELRAGRGGEESSRATERGGQVRDERRAAQHHTAGTTSRVQLTVPASSKSTPNAAPVQAL